jgi:hypothetical protein
MVYPARDVSGPILQDVDRRGAQDESEEGIDAAEGKRRDEVDGEHDREDIRVHVRSRDRVQRARNPGIERGQRERQRLVAREADAGRGRGDLAVADRLQRAAGLAADEQPCRDQQDEGDAPRQVVDPVVRARGQAERRLQEAEQLAAGAAEEVVELERDLPERDRDAERHEG